MKKDLILFAASLLVAFFILEGAVRVLFPDNPLPYRLNDAKRFIPEIGVLKQPNQTVTEVAPCFEIQNIKFNDAGFRATPEPVNPKYRIAVLGDSYVEAMQIPNGLDVSSRLGDMLGARIFNEGIGGANIIKAFSIYANSTRAKQPNIVLLMLYGSNDILDSNCKFLDRKAKLLGLDTREICAIPAEPIAGIRAPRPPADLAPEVEPRRPNSPREMMKSWCRSCDLLYGLARQIGYVADGDLNFVTGEQINLPVSSLEGTIQSEVRDAWLITKEMLGKFRDQVRADNAQLVIVLIPNHSQISPTWRQEYQSYFGQQPPEGYDPGWHERRLLDISRELDIPTVALSEHFRRYQADQRLPFPNLSYRCDGHWNPLGHFIAASVVAEFLAGKGYITVDKPDDFVSVRQSERRQSARSVIGDLAYDQIFGRGIYRPAK